MSLEIKRVIPMEKLLEKGGSVYKLVIVAAKRALELSEGSPKLVTGNSNEKPALVALREIAEGKIGIRSKKSKGKGD